jgi:hypothetical protein
MLKIGIIGLGPHWETIYRPALARLSRRICVTAVYDTAPRAARVGEELQAACLSGIRALLDRSDVQAAVILDDAWHGLAPVRFAIEHRKPAYVGVRLSAPLPSLAQLCQRAADESVLIMPEQRLRASPATTRVQELAATRLGAIEQIQVEMRVKRHNDLARHVVPLIDWCSALLRSLPTTCEVSLDESGGLRLDVSFRQQGSDRSPRSAIVRLQAGNSGSSLKARIRCRDGEIHVTSDTELRWHTAAADESERLDRDRSHVEVLLDHFARRVVGGLIPVPGLDDICRVLQFLAPYEAAIRSGMKRSTGAGSADE